MATTAKVKRNFMVEQSLWRKAERVAKRQHMSVAALIRQAMRDYIAASESETK